MAADMCRGRPRAASTGSRRTVLLLLALCSATGALLVAGVPASALISRGHVFSSTFEGAGEAAFSDPTGVAVSEATGEVYVVDKTASHEQVERFKPDAHGGYEFVSAFKVKSPEDIAIDNSTSGSDPSRGDVYVVGAEEEDTGSEEHAVLYKYSPASGKVIFKRTIFHAKVARETDELELEDISGVAVDASGTLWVYWSDEGIISAFNDAEANGWQPSLTKDSGVEEAFECRARAGFAVAPNDEYFYLAHERETVQEACPEEEGTPVQVAELSDAGQLLARGLDGEDTSGVAVDSSDGDVYADNASSIAAFSPDGALIQRFGAGDLTGGGAVAVDSSLGDVFVAEPTQDKVAVFGPDGAGPPIVDSVYAQSRSATSERLSAEIDPDGAATTYYFQYGTASCTGNSSSCTDIPSAPGPEVGSGYGDQTVKVELTDLQPNTTYYYRVLAHSDNGTAESLQGTEAFFTTLPSAQGTLLDHRSWELVSPPEKHGATVEPISREGAEIQASADGNAITWAASSPVTGETAGNRAPEPVQVLSSRNAGDGWSSTDITTSHNQGEGIEPGEATEYRFFSPDLSQALAQPQILGNPLESPPLEAGVTEKTMYRRNDATDAFEALVTPANDTASTPFGGKLEFAGATPDLAHVVFESQVPLIAGASGEGLYEWEAGAPLKLLSLLPGSQTTAASEPTLGDLDRDTRNAISSDGTRVVWTNGNKGEGPLYLRDTSTGQTTQLNAAQGVPEAGQEEIEEGLDEVHFQDASSTGSKVFFTDTWPLTAESSLEPHAAEEVVAEPPDGNRNAGRPADLYEFDVETGKLTDLTPDERVGESAAVLGTIPGVSEDGSEVYFVANGVLAPGAEPGDCPRTKPDFPQAAAACNLYLSEPDPELAGRRETRLIARVSAEDAADWDGGDTPAGSLGGLTSQVSSNGRYLAFMSQRELTGYDNVDANPEARGAHDEEVFVYDAGLGRLVCASCNPDGKPPHGVFDTQAAGEGLGLVADRPQTWSGHWLAGSIPGWTLFELSNPMTDHQSRYLTDGGRLFFDSADALAPQVSAPARDEEVGGKTLSVGVENAYEYEPDAEGSCTSLPGCVALVSSGTSSHESAFLDASEDGNDVFFLTAAQLVPQDADNSLDLYDARVCGTPETQACLPAFTPPPPPCAGEECRAPAESPSGLSTPATSTFSGPADGSPSQAITGVTKVTPKKVLTTAQKLAQALKACKKLKNRHKLAECDTSARKKYRAHSKTQKTTAKRAALTKRDAR